MPTASSRHCVVLPVEDLLIDTYYYLAGSLKPKEEFREFQQFVGVDMEDILKHVSTRWLCLERCVNRTIRQWPAVKEYLESDNDRERPGRVKRCADNYSSPGMKLMYHFLQLCWQLQQSGYEAHVSLTTVMLTTTAVWIWSSCITSSSLCWLVSTDSTYSSRQSDVSIWFSKIEATPNRHV